MTAFLKSLKAVGIIIRSIIEKRTNVRVRHMREPESGKSRIKAPELIRQGIGVGDVEIDIPGGYAFLGDIQRFRRCVGRDDDRARRG